MHPGVNGYLYPPGNTAMLAEHLTRLLSSASLRQTMGSESRILAADHDIHATLARFEALCTAHRAHSPAPTAAAA